MNCQEIEDISGAYALGAVTPQEALHIEAHLSRCAQCQSTVRELEAVAHTLPLSLPPKEPAPAVKKRLLSQIVALEAQALRPSLPPQGRPPRRQRPSFSLRTGLVAAAAVFVCVFLAVMAIWNVSLREQLAAVSAQSLSYPLHSTTGTPAVTGRVVYFPQEHVTAIIINGLPSLPGSEVYQGWLIRGKQPTSIGLLNMRDGTASLSFEGDLQGYDTVAISVEQGPRATPGAPKGKIVASGVLHSANVVGTGPVSVSELFLMISILQDIAGNVDKREG